MTDGRLTPTVKILAALLILSMIGNICLVIPYFIPEGQAVQKPAGEMTNRDTRGVSLQGTQNASATGVWGEVTMQGPAVIEIVNGRGANPFGMATSTTKGTMLNISVEIQPGQGRVLVETEPLMGIVFQDAAITAVQVAQNVTGRSLVDADVIFSVEGDAEIPAVDGPSAGALMTSLAIAALSGETPQTDVTLTGTIDESGKIGAIGGVIEKAEAAKVSGKSTILLPEENAQLVQYTEEVRRFGPISRLERVGVVVDAKEYIEREIGISVIYVNTINDVGQYLGLSA